VAGVGSSTEATRDFAGRRGRFGVCIRGMGDEGTRLGKKSFGVGGLVGGEDVVADTAVRGGGISGVFVERCCSVARKFASLVSAGGLSSITITSLAGCWVELCDPLDLGLWGWGGVTGKRSSAEFSWLGS